MRHTLQDVIPVGRLDHLRSAVGSKLQTSSLTLVPILGESLLTKQAITSRGQAEARLTHVTTQLGRHEL